MTPKHLCILLLALLLTVGGASAQSEDITVENDNQFPPENPAEPDLIDGSGDGAVEQPRTADATTPVPLEDVQPSEHDTELTTPPEDQSCPDPCVCHYDGNSNFVVGCSGYGLTQFPSPINPKTTVLNLQNNKLTEIPKDVSALKNLKVLNVENNSIKDLALGSVSDLPELTVLKLANNRLLEYPRDLKNSLQLSKLQELDLGGNDIRKELKPEILSNLPALHHLTLAVSTPELLQDLCEVFKSTLEYVCTNTCDKDKFDCSEGPHKIEDGFIDATLPGMIPLESDQNGDSAVNAANVNNANGDSGTEDTPAVSSDDSIQSITTDEPVPAVVSGFGRSGLVGEQTTQQKLNNIVETPKETNTKSETDVKVGATTTDAKTGGVDKSIIGIIVAGMVVVVAAITIKKNWSSIKKRFSSSPRPAERTPGAHANGTSPEEVPLQDKDKSPV